MKYRQHPTVFLTAYSHLDTQWRWDYRATIELYLKQTLEENFRLLERYPSYRFNFTGALRYMMIREYYPAMYEELSRYAAEYRWYPAGTSLDETDAIVPSAESTIRNILYGHNFFTREFGYSSSDYMLPDSFGFPGNLPTILSHCGITGFSTQKLTWRSVNGIPFDLGNWIGPDGSAVPSVFMPGRYTGRIRFLPYTIYRWKSRLRAHRRSWGFPKDYRYYGTGDTGGAPDERSVRRVERLLAKKIPFVRQESSDRFFTTLTRRERDTLPTYSGDLLLTRHSAGILTSQTVMKRWNHIAERLAFTAEAAAVTAAWTTGCRHNTQLLQDSWYRLIGNQMHDILPGTATPKAYTYAYNDAVLAANGFNTVLLEAAANIASRMELPEHREDDTLLLLFNPDSTGHHDLVTAEITGVTYSSRIRAYTDTDEPLPIQILDQKGEKATVLTAVRMEPLSWRVIRISEKPNGDTAPVLYPASARMVESGALLENRILRVHIGKEGAIESIYRKGDNDGAGREFLRSPAGYELQRERPKIFPAWNMDWKDRKKAGRKITSDQTTVFIIEQGPLQATVRIEIPFGKHGKSRIVRTVSLGIFGNEELVQISEHISWYERGCSLKAMFPLRVSSDSVIGSWETSRTKYRVNTPKQYEFPTRRWLDQSDRSGGHGFSVLVPYTYGFDHPEEHILRLTLLFTPGRSPLTVAFRDQMSQDWGEHHIDYALYPHRGDAEDAETDLRAGQLDHPVRVFRLVSGELAKHTAQPVKELISLLQLSSRQLSLLSCKPCEEDPDFFIVRIRENLGKPLENASIAFGSRILAAEAVNGLEQRIGAVNWYGKTATFSVPANGICALKVRLAAFTGRKSFIPHPVTIMKFPLNTRMISANGDLEAGSGPFFPRELIPQQIIYNQIIFRLQTTSNLNALVCGGELLTVPDIAPGVRADTIYVLAAADVETPAVFGFPEAPDRQITVTVPPMTGFIGQYDTRVWTHPPREPRDYIWKNQYKSLEPGYIKRYPLAWYATHMHGAGADFPYYFGYLYCLKIELPPEVGSIQLPRDARIKIFALSASDSRISVSSAEPLSDTFDIEH